MNNVLIIGFGGREHALARAFAKSTQVQTVYVAPGNPGMVIHDEQIECVNIQATDFESLVNFVVNESVTVTLVGAEQPLELGIVDYFNEKGLAIVGPSKVAAKLENSKHFAKEIMKQAAVETAQYRFFSASEFQDAIDYVNTLSLPLVIKADGLMDGKGVVIPETMEEAYSCLELMMQTKGKNVLIEEFLVGNEFSHFSLVNGSHIIPIASACDYKRSHDNDLGLNTGGMGAFAPIPWFDESKEERVLKDIVQAVADQMVENGTPFTGIIYTGAMWTESGPKVIEFNTRFGDPETQVVLPLIENDFYDVIQAHLNKEDIEIRLKDQFNLGIVLAAKGYPADPIMNIPIKYTEEWAEQVYYAGVRLDDNDQLVSKGGRILMLTSSGETLQEARENAYSLMHQLKVQNSFYRNDIGLNREMEE
ncbi:phosphoribosylamine--glycine ligase [Aerococcaceae bacterium WGS1372]